jgi:hypothetical protein
MFMHVFGCFIKAPTIFIIAVFLCFACGCNPGAPGYTTEEPNKNDLVGTWTPDQATLEDMKKRGGYDITKVTMLVIKSDGSLEIINMPDWWEAPFGDSQGRMGSHSGSWSIYNDSMCWTVAIKYSDRASFLNLIGNKPPYKMEIILGDPDSGHSMIFVKQVSQ